jgi:hypothetical protein
VFDRLQIGKWQIYEDYDGGLQFFNSDNSRKIILPYIKSNDFTNMRGKIIDNKGNIDADIVKTNYYHTRERNFVINDKTFEANKLYSTKKTNVSNYLDTFKLIVDGQLSIFNQDNSTRGTLIRNIVNIGNSVNVRRIDASQGYIGYSKSWDVKADGAFYGRFV